MGFKPKGKKRWRSAVKGSSNVAAPTEDSAHASSNSSDRMLEESHPFPKAPPVPAPKSPTPLAPTLPRIEEVDFKAREEEVLSSRHQKRRRRRC